MMAPVNASIPATAWRELITAAIRAPSGDNRQPWRFRVDPEAGRIVIAVDEQRDPSPMNAGQRMARIAVGAAAENILRTARFNEVPATIETGRETDSIAVHVNLPPAGMIRHDPAVTARVTNRRFYDGRPVPAEALTVLQAATPPIDGARTVWLTERKRIDQAARIIGRADAMLFSVPQMRQAFFENVRFDCPGEAEVDEGLSLASLELKRQELPLFKLLRRLPNAIVRILRVPGTIGSKSAKLVRSSSGICLVVAADDRPATDLTVGRALERAWLALTERGMSAQPMMSLLVLESARKYASIELRRSVSMRIQDHVIRLIAVAGESKSSRLAFILRFGWSQPPSGRTGRLGNDDVTTH